ncbi:tubulin epsilon and delta complex protein 2 [Boleophthalmus pectinirostris]|uniref:tubulin epsilon and delta complex protein 2 n=1 Tax=Boleophthalmus pectinirostris TaxID=150288 RepID=UPI00242E2F6E|nr:tubulin epsilon and delta complex protein 2 [Boleophthalmus pectinirostris]
MKMALYIVIEDKLKSWKEQQARIHQSIQLCTEILDVLTSQPRSSPGFQSECNLPTDTSQVDKEEIDLLEKALEKALRVRSGLDPVTGIVKPPLSQNKEGSAATKDSLQSSKGQTKTDKLISKTTEQKKQRKYQTTVLSSLSMKPADGLKCLHSNAPKKTMGGLPHHGQHTPPSGSKKQIIKMGGTHSKESFTSTPASFSKTTESGGNCLIQQEILKWTHLKHKEKRLWDKILALERKSSVPGRDHFMTRMRHTFPMRWPCGSPEKIQALVHRLFQQGKDPTDDRQMGDLMALQTPEDDKNQGDTKLTCEMLKLTSQEIHQCAVQVKREWESWDRWRPEWGCLCPKRAEVVGHEGRTAPLPITVTYTTDGELTKLETLRMRVAQLQQEVCLETALSNTLAPHLSSVVQKSVNPSLLRDLYSVLGEGGERFPAIVLDSEPDS